MSELEQQLRVAQVDSEAQEDYIYQLEAQSATIGSTIVHDWLPVKPPSAYVKSSPRAARQSFKDGVRGLQTLKSAISTRKTSNMDDSSERSSTEIVSEIPEVWGRSLKDAITIQCAARIESIKDNVGSDVPVTPRHDDAELNHAITHSVDCFVDLISLVRVQHEMQEGKSSSRFKQIAKRAREKYQDLSKEAAAALAVVFQ